MIYQSLQIWEIVNRIFLKKIARARSVLAGPTRGESGLDLPASRGIRIQRADERGPAVRRQRTRNGTGQPGPSDQVMIDGPRPSSSSDRRNTAETLAAARQGAGAQLGAFPGDEEVTGWRGARRRARRGAAAADWSPGRRSACRQWRNSTGRPHMVIDLMFLDQERGRIRLVVYRGVHECSK
jgi:hypothetical protein